MFKDINMRYAFLVLFSIFCLITTASADVNRCTVDDVFVLEDPNHSNEISVKTSKEKKSIDYFAINSKTKLSDKTGNSYYFLSASDLGSCGDSPVLVTALNGKLLIYDFPDRECGNWEAIMPNKIVGYERIAPTCTSGTCNACEPMKPTIWEIMDCTKKGMNLHKRETIDELLQDSDGKKVLKSFIDNERLLMEEEGQNVKSLNEIENNDERNFCKSVLKKEPLDKILRLLRKAVKENEFWQNKKETIEEIK